MAEMTKGMEKANKAIKKGVTIVYEITIKFIKRLAFDGHFCLLAIYTISHFLSLFEPSYPFI